MFYQWRRHSIHTDTDTIQKKVRIFIFGQLEGYPPHTHKSVLSFIYKLRGKNCLQFLWFLKLIASLSSKPLEFSRHLYPFKRFDIFFKFQVWRFNKLWGYQLCWLHYTKHWMKKCGKTKKTFCLFLLDNLTAYVYGPRCSHLHTVSNSWRFCSRTLVLRPKHACLRLKIKADLLWTFKFRTIRIKNLFILLVGPKQ